MDLADPSKSPTLATGGSLARGASARLWSKNSLPVEQVAFRPCRYSPPLAVGFPCRAHPVACRYGFQRFSVLSVLSQKWTGTAQVPRFSDMAVWIAGVRGGKGHGMAHRQRLYGYWLALAVLAAPWPMPGGRALADTFQVTKTLDTRDGTCDSRAWWYRLPACTTDSADVSCASWLQSRARHFRVHVRGGDDARGRCPPRPPVPGRWEMPRPYADDGRAGPSHRFSAAGIRGDGRGTSVRIECNGSNVGARHFPVQEDHR